jgi:hypothetical protein
LTRLLLHWIPIFILPLMAFSLVARALGDTQSASTILDGFTVGCQGKPQPCWYGIVPHQTSVLIAQAVLEELGYQVKVIHTGILSQLQAELPANRECKVYSTLYNDSVTSLEILTCDVLYLGDFIEQFGLPEIARVCNFYANVQVRLIFSAARASLNQRASTLAHKTSPYDRVSHISLDESLSDSPRWYGFLPYWRYQQLKSESLEC